MRPALILLGHFPPPRGGIATHLDRLRDALTKSNINVRCISFGNNDPAHTETLLAKKHPFAFLLALLRGAGILHYHTDESDWKSAVLIGLWCFVRRQKYFFTLHSFRDHNFLRSAWSRGLVHFVYRHASTIICISENLRLELHQLLPLPGSRVIVVPSFLPVTEREMQEPPPRELAVLSHRYPAIISFNAFSTALYDNADLYGGDILLDAFALIQDEFPEAGLLMVYLNFNDGPVAQTVEQKSQSLGDRVAIIKNYSGSFIPVFTRSAVFVRATSNDGGPSLSVLEALSLGVWTIASDAVPRPSECQLFTSRSAQDLARALRETLLRLRNGEKQSTVSFDDAVHQLIPSYNSFQS